MCMSDRPHIVSIVRGTLLRINNFSDNYVHILVNHVIAMTVCEGKEEEHSAEKHKMGREMLFFG